MLPLSIIIPIYNEALNIETLYKEIVLSLNDHPFEIIFINDGSTDETFSCLNQLIEKDKRVKAIHHKRNFGQSAALVTGQKVPSTLY